MKKKRASKDEVAAVIAKQKELADYVDKLTLKEKRLAEIRPLAEDLFHANARRLLMEIENWTEEVYQQILTNWQAEKRAREEAAASRLLPVSPFIPGQEAIEGEAPFIRGVDPDGKPAWRMSAVMAKKYNELRGYSEIKNKEVQAAACALLTAEHRFFDADMGEPDDYEDRPVHHTESIPAFTGFLMPLAKRLNALRKPENQIANRRKEIRKEAEEWFKIVLESAFPDHLGITPTEQDAVNVIHALWRLCEELGTHATKKDVKERGGLQWSPTQWKKLFKMAGLHHDLHESGKERY